MDVNAILRAYLVADSSISSLVGTRIYCPRLVEGATLPAISYFVRGGTSTPYLTDIVIPSFQIDCWASSSMSARGVYMAVYDALQGIQNNKVTIATKDYYILSAREEVQGVDIVDEDIPNYFRCLSFWEVKIRR